MRPKQHFTYKYESTTHTKGGAILHIWEKHKKTLNLNLSLKKTKAAASPRLEFFFLLHTVAPFSSSLAAPFPQPQSLFLDFLPSSPTPENPRLPFVFPSADRNLQPSTISFPPQTNQPQLLHNTDPTPPSNSPAAITKFPLLEPQLPSLPSHRPFFFAGDVIPHC